MATAYLIGKSRYGQIVGADIWSSAPWQQSVMLPNVLCGVYLEVSADTYSNAREHLIRTLVLHTYYHEALRHLVCMLGEDERELFFKEVKANNFSDHPLKGYENGPARCAAHA